MDPKDIELMTSQIYLEETADDAGSKIKRAILKIPLINVGDNSKNLRWTEETMKKVAHMFRGVPFRYDLNGQNEGSHTKDKLSSPFYDVGWTYQDQRGAYYDPEKKTIWVSGEVTNPQVIEKLQRQTSDGRREIHYASMGALIDPKDTKCSVCGKAPFGMCGHTRGETYRGETCSMVPTNVKKALHVALTNDPADKVAEIAEAVFQDMSLFADNNRMDSPVGFALNIPGADNASTTASELKGLMQIILKTKLSKKADENKTIPEEDSKMIEDKKDKKKVTEKVEGAVEAKATQPINDANEKSVLSESLVTPSDVDKSIDEQQIKDGENEEEDKKKKKKVVETAESEMKEKMQSKKEEKDEHEKKESKSEEKKEHSGKSEEEEDDEEKEKKKKKKKDDEKEMADDGIEFSLKGPALGSKSEQKVEFADNAPKSPVLETASNDIYAKKYKAKLLQELADAYVKFNKAESSQAAILVLQDKSIEQLEIYQEAFSGIQVAQPAQPAAQAKPVLVTQSNNHVASKFVNDVPEFGGMGAEVDSMQEVADMTPTDRRKTFGEYGSFDLCFNPQNAQRYRKK